MANGVSFTNVIIEDELKSKYKIALIKEGISMKTHITNCIQELIDKHGEKKTSKKK